VSREREARDFEFEADFRMRTICMIGGMSWESSAIYYWMVNKAVKERLGGHHSADTLMYSVDFAPINRLSMRAGGKRRPRPSRGRHERLNRVGRALSFCAPTPCTGCRT